MHLNSYTTPIFPDFCELKAWRCFSWGTNKRFWIGPIFVRRNEYRLWKRGIKIVYLSVQVIPCILIYALHSTLHATSSNANFKIRTSICHTFTLYCPKCNLMFTVTHSIQAAIPLSTCCEVSSYERTLNLRSYYMQHSNLALSTINLTAAHKITAVTHNKLFPIELIKPLFLLQIACL